MQLFLQAFDNSTTRSQRVQANPLQVKLALPLPLWPIKICNVLIQHLHWVFVNFLSVPKHD